MFYGVVFLFVCLILGFFLFFFFWGKRKKKRKKKEGKGGRDQDSFSSNNIITPWEILWEIQLSVMMRKQERNGKTGCEPVNWLWTLLLRVVPFKFQIWKILLCQREARWAPNKFSFLFVYLLQAILFHVNGKMMLLRRGCTGLWPNKGSGI